jgi:hypothetical protein
MLLGPDGTNEFEVYITSFNDEGKPITAERLQNESHLDLTNDSPITIGTVQGIQFDLPDPSTPSTDSGQAPSTDSTSSPQASSGQAPSTGSGQATTQAWFEYQGYLYQAETYTSDTDLLEQVLASWRFSP